MCSVDVSMKIYECGERVKDDFNFNPCKDIGIPACPGRKENPLASSKVKGKCGKANCRNPLSTAWSNYRVGNLTVSSKRLNEIGHHLKMLWEHDRCDHHIASREYHAVS
jgi:hypothetical protein